MAAPGSGEAEVAGRRLLGPEPGPPDEGDRGDVAWLDARPQRLKTEAKEGVAHQELEALGHEALSGEAGMDVVAAVRSVQHRRDLVEVEDSHDESVGQPAHQERRPRALAGPHEEGPVVPGFGGGTDPLAVQLAARP